ncbi:hypothetical protein [Massilia sp. TS11]|uniref:hypothetical protein n=1 Tax=Massilia sp. TS11 TaxID=2908003 RepID=UPI001EDA545A|nr:hypothetical protein [Massilia sp. TS11]MCG2583509.1 hypothetical protein [Massilia sp. TS11]
MPSTKRSRPLLKPEHFSGLRTQMTEKGLSFATNVCAEDRSQEIWRIGTDEQIVEDYLDKIERLRPVTSVHANPIQFSYVRLRRELRKAQITYRPKEEISLTYALGKKYDLKWSSWVDSDDGSRVEGQGIVLVAFDKDEVLGFLDLSVFLTREPERKAISIFHELVLVYVHAGIRKQGLGIDLSIACGQLCQDVLVACYRAAPSGAEISSTLYADFVYEGGEHIFNQVTEAIDFQAELLRDLGRRPSITVKNIEKDACY